MLSLVEHFEVISVDTTAVIVPNNDDHITYTYSQGGCFVTGIRQVVRFGVENDAEGISIFFVLAPKGKPSLFDCSKAHRQIADRLELSEGVESLLIRFTPSPLENLYEDSWKAVVLKDLAPEELQKELEGRIEDFNIIIHPNKWSVEEKTNMGTPLIGVEVIY